ncbi:MAG: hypothetical protein H7Y20_02615, partial [Bryobacteraceae bacterium]|nr:hypothetical protein [Bryobacteraceae bacterium]
MLRRKIGLIWAACACFTGVTSGVTINVTMDTSALVQNVADQPYHIQFVLTNAELLTSHDPGGPFVNPSNTVTASNFLFGGGSGIDPIIDPGYLIDGGATGDIRSSVHLEANHATNYFSQGFLPGSTLSFTLDFTHNVAVSHTIFDVFSFTIIDSQYTALPTAGGQNHHAFLEIDFESDDPTILTFPSDPNTPTSAGILLDIPAPAFAHVNAPIPEPGTFSLGGGACLALILGRKFRHKLRKAAPVSLAVVAAVLAGTSVFAAPGELSPEVFEGKFRGRVVKYQVLNGLAIAEGDMVIGEATLEEGPNGVRTSRLTTREADEATGKAGSKRYSHSVEGSAHLWPKVNGIVTVPYKITRGSQTMTTALNQFNAQFAGRIQWVPRTNQRAYIDINLGGQSSNSCFATLGYTGSVGILQGVDGGCAVFAMLHEMAHVLGFAHEQSRADRDRYLTIDYSNIAFGSRGAYDQEIANNVDIGLFDYVSLMHYAPRGFGRNGNPEMESIPPGIPFGDPPTFSPGDLDAINRLYFTTPTAVTVDTAPTGLPIIVDGLTYISPRTFNWALNSSHTLDVVSGPQTSNGSNYLFGRWNSDLNGDLAPRRQITVNPGNGSFGHAASAPDVTVYTANYIKLTPFNPSYILDNVFST